MRIERKWFLAIAVVLTSLWLVVNPRTRADENRIRWDIISLGLSGTTPTINPGGNASAHAQDASMITVTGTGTFTVGESDDVTGGGTWKTIASDGTTVTGMGNYLVTRLIRFDVAPGDQNTAFHDNIGDGTLTDNRAGLVYLGIAYDDGTRGILVVSCHLGGNPLPQGPDATPASVFEGITASKGFVDYWNRVAPAGSPSTPNANRTLFHIHG